MNAPDPNSITLEQQTSDSRRRLVLGLTAAGAGLLGVGAAWWRTQTPDAPPHSPPAEGFWTSQFEMPQGGTVSMSALRGRPLLVNFWATWCAPCVEELPLINDFYRQNKANGWQVVGLAVDKLAPVQAFLQKMPLDFPVGMAGLVGAELSRGMGNLVGGLPFSVVLGSDGMVLQRKMGRLVPDDLANWLRLK
ncbi:MAG: TlpA disulfide reductase family protein [Rhodoferax sp.]